MKNVLRHLRSLIAPAIMGFLLPISIAWSERQSSDRLWLNFPTGLNIAGFVISAIGLVLLILTVRMFIQIGKGTIMPWDPTRKLIIVGIYRHVRNPMILGVLLLQVGQAILFASSGIAWLAVGFFVVNTFYFTFSEEPGLEKRFGQEYIEYKRNVPRWIPRLKPWQPG